MAGFLLHEGATVMCSHGGQATPGASNARVTVGGQPTAWLPVPWIVAGCALVPPPLPPCAVGQWTTGTTRVTSSGLPLVIDSGTSVSIPAGTPLEVSASQTRVKAI
jgi:hypothetical protein